MTAPDTPERRTVGLFVTCLVDLFRPSVGMAAVALLRRAGCDVVVPAAQTCCGQPAYNSGDRADARAVARTAITAFRGLPCVVAPSGSCAGMVRRHYPALFADDPEWRDQAADLAARTWELTAFLTDMCGMTDVGAALPARATYHDSCSGLRELGVQAQPRALLRSVAGLSLAEHPSAETCCGFGGAFCVKYPDIADAMAARKIADIAATDAGLLIGGDLGCLMHLGGSLSRQGSAIAVRHVAEVLAGDSTTPPIGRGRG